MMAKNYEPYKAIGEDLPTPIIQSVSPSQLIPGISQIIIIFGLYLTEETWVQVEDCTTEWTELINPNELQVSLIPEDKPGDKELRIERHRGEDYHNLGKLLLISNFEENPQVDEKGWLELTSSAELSIGEGADSDVRHYKKVKVSRNGNGLYWDKNGWVSFPALKWDATQDRKSLDFVFYLEGNKYLTFGVINENYNRSRYQISEARCAYRLARYYFCGAYGNGLNNRLEYRQVPRYKYYRFRINNNAERGQKVQLFQLAGKDRKYWDNGILYWQDTIPLNFIENGEVLTPAIFEYNTSSNPILAVRTL